MLCLYKINPRRGQRKNASPLLQLGISGKRPLQVRLVSSGGGFGAEDALETGAGELYADDVFTDGGRVSDVHYAAVRGEVNFVVAAGVMAMRDADFEIRADGHVEARDERGPAAAQIFAGSIFFEGDAATVASADFQRQAHGDSTFRPLLGGRAELDHEGWPLFP
jgi:hypothetical protein